MPATWALPPFLNCINDVEIQSRLVLFSCWTFIRISLSIRNLAWCSFRNSKEMVNARALLGKLSEKTHENKMTQNSWRSAANEQIISCWNPRRGCDIAKHQIYQGIDAEMDQHTNPTPRSRVVLLVGIRLPKRTSRDSRRPNKYCKWSTSDSCTNQYRVSVFLTLEQFEQWLRRGKSYFQSSRKLCICQDDIRIKRSVCIFPSLCALKIYSNVVVDVNTYWSGQVNVNNHWTGQVSRSEWKEMDSLFSCRISCHMMQLFDDPQ
jgi:hypothetical protein